LKESTPQTVGSLGNVSILGRGSAHACAVDSGIVACWGSNDRNQLAKPSTVAASSVPLAVPGVSNIVQLAGGEGHTCAMNASGAVWCWGENSAGQLGNASNTSSVTPVAIGPSL
jgi:alpha-tubulin suppressor-like RCC1 family protein